VKHESLSAEIGAAPRTASDAANLPCTRTFTNRQRPRTIAGRAQERHLCV